MKTLKELPTLPNGLPLWKMMQYKVTGEQCRVVKINDKIAEGNIDDITVDIKIIRITATIKHTVIIEKVILDNLIIWNESMNPHREVKYKRRGDIQRTVIYN